MGASTSKAAKTASKLSPTNAARKYPTRLPPPSNRPNTHSPHASPNATRRGIEYTDTRAAEGAGRGTQTDPEPPGADPALASRLRTLGPVQPNPAYSPTSSFTSGSLTSSNLSPSKHSKLISAQNHPSNDPSLLDTQFQPSASNPTQSIFPSTNTHHQNPAILLLTARYRIAEEAEKEFSLVSRGKGGRTFLDVATLRDVLVMRDREGASGSEIERRLGLGKGVVERLGVRGVVGVGE